MNRGVEIAAEVADSIERSVIADQVANGISVRMALLYLLLGGPTEGFGRRGPGNPEGVPRSVEELSRGGAPMGRVTA
jgi:hypothetical protein